MHRMRARIADKRVLDLVKAFLKAGILSEERMLRKLGRHLGYSDYDVRLVIRRQYQERYGQAKAALRAARHDDGWDGQ